MKNIVTSICVDEDEHDDKISYPSTLRASSSDRRLIYWKCAVVFFASAVRCNPKDKLILYTNDKKEVIFKNIDLKDFLKQKGVEIRHLPFQHFKPPAGYSESYKNAFYKLDVLKALGDLSQEYSILLDSDCVWIQPSKAFDELIESENILLYDVYDSKTSHISSFRNTRLALGKLYKQLNADYPLSEPIQYGGELFSGKGENLKYIADRISEIYAFIVSTYKEKPPQFQKNVSIFDGDEWLSAYVLNNMPLKIVEASAYINRIWNTFKISNTKPENLNLAIWHMPFEKTQGMPLLFDKILDKESQFWSCSIADFKFYLGKYLGVPKPFVRQRIFMLIRKFTHLLYLKIKN